MQCSCIKNIYDVYVGHNGCKELVYEDQSVWMEEEGYAIPESYTVKVTTPSNSEVNLDLKVGCRNRITTADLFLSEEPICLEDGIYCFTTESCGVEYKLTRAYLCNIRCKIDKIIADRQFQDNFDDIIRYKALADSVETNAKQNNVNRAQELLGFLKNELKGYDCDNC